MLRALVGPVILIDGMDHDGGLPDLPDKEFLYLHPLLWSRRLRELLDAIRQQGHVAESPHAGSHSWTRQRSHFSDEAFFQSPCGGDVSPAGYLEDSEGATSAAASYFDEEGWEACGSCGAYTAETEEDGNSTDT